MNWFAQYDVSKNALARNWTVIEASRSDRNLALNRALWFLPSFDHIYRGGIYTIFRVANTFSNRYGTDNIITLHGGKRLPLGMIEDSITEAFPRLRFELLRADSIQDVSTLPRSDVAFCTLWTTAYLLVHYNYCKSKFYFIQDFEPAFYPAGSMYGLIEQTYRFGFNGLANTPGVAEIYRQYNPWVQAFVPGVDKSIFRPHHGDSSEYRRKRLVFYGRPQNDRNAFELGTSALRNVKEAMGEDIEIISVGAEYDESDYGLEGVLKNWGVVDSLSRLAALYRSAQAGLVFMYTAHPSYQPFEFMATGCATVSNFNRYTQWLLKDGQNSALAESTATRVADRIIELLENDDLRETIRQGGFQTVADKDWPSTLSQICDTVTDFSPSYAPFIEANIEHQISARADPMTPNGSADLRNIVIAEPKSPIADKKPFSSPELANLFSGTYDFADFGCSEGGSFAKAEKWFGGKRGLGFDIDPEKVREARSRGLDAVNYDVRELPVWDSVVRFVIASHFIEHLPDKVTALKCLRSACQLAREFVYVEIPYFDADGYLFHHGLKLYWSDWSGHTYQPTSLELYDILRTLMQETSLRRFAIYAADPITSSEDESVHSLRSPIDQHDWRGGLHPPKPGIEFESPVYRTIRALIGTGKEDQFGSAEMSFRWNIKLFDSRDRPDSSWQRD